jgi:hypothetical protein
MLANVQLQLLSRLGVPPPLVASLNGKGRSIAWSKRTSMILTVNLLSDLRDFLSKQPPQSLHPILDASIYGEDRLLGQLCRLTDKSYSRANHTNPHIHISRNQFFLTKSAI